MTAVLEAEEAAGSAGPDRAAWPRGLTESY
jgi:hypothetical protein